MTRGLISIFIAIGISVLFILNLRSGDDDPCCSIGIDLPPPGKYIEIVKSREYFHSSSNRQAQIVVKSHAKADVFPCKFAIYESDSNGKFITEVSELNMVRADIVSGIYEYRSREFYLNRPTSGIIIYNKHCKKEFDIKNSLISIGDEVYE